MNGAIRFDELKIALTLPEKTIKKILKNKEYNKVNFNELVLCPDPDINDELVVGFACWYSYQEVSDAVKILEFFGIGDDIEVYIPKDIKTLLVKPRDKEIYLGIPPKTEDAFDNPPKFLLKEEDE